MTICALAMAVFGVAAPTAAATASPVAVTALNCQHSSGDGVVRSADHLHLYSNYDTHIGAVQLCKDGSSRFWGYMVLYSPLPSGRWGNAYLEAYYNGQYRATYSCEGYTPSSRGNGHVEPGQTMCWTPKLYGTSTSWTYYVYAWTCVGPFNDTSNCYAEGRTRFTWR